MIDSGSSGSNWGVDWDRQAMGDFGSTSLKLTVRWYALPLRHAQKRWASLRPEVERRRNRGRSPFYIIGVSGFPTQLFRHDPEKLKGVSELVTSQSFLEIKGRDPIPAVGTLIPVGPSEVVNVRLRPWRVGAEIILMFPREENGAPTITLEDKKVEFVTEIGSLKVRRKFKLKKMIYNGNLEL
jgi:hypothetical protein